MGIVSAVINGIAPYLSGRLFDSILTPSTIAIGASFQMPLYAFFLILWGALQIFTHVSSWISARKISELGINLSMDYTTDGYSHLILLPLSFHKKHKIGSIMNRISRAANGIEQILIQLVDLTPQLLSIIVALFIIYSQNYILALVITAGVLVYLAIFIPSLAPLAAMKRKENATFSKAYGDVGDALLNVSAVKQAAAETYETRRIYKNMKEKVMTSWLPIMRLRQGLNFYQRLIILLTQLAVFVLSINFINQGRLTLGELVAFNAYAALVFSPFISLARSWQQVQDGVLLIETAEKILKTPTEKYMPERIETVDVFSGNIKFENVEFYYEKGKSVLQNINFEVKPGEMVALVGESGVGKSTLIDLISGYHFAKGGKVLLDGHSVKNLDLKELRSHIGIVPQEVVLFNDTIRKNIAYGSFDATLEDIQGAARKAHAHEFIEKFPKKWSQMVGERGVKLSVGQKQRVAIARAILRDPAILILDEPTSALDAHSEHIISQSLEELMRGRTTFIIAHRLSTVRKADKILVFKEGKIVEMGNHQTLLKIEDGMYKKLYEYQIGLHS